MKNATRLSPEAIERLQEPAHVDEGIENPHAHDPSMRGGGASFAASDRDRAVVHISAEIFEWFHAHAKPGESADAAIVRVLSDHIQGAGQAESITSSAA